MTGPDALRALYLPPDASIEDVKRAHRELAMLLHPDRGGDPVRFRQLQEVYEVALSYVEAARVGRSRDREHRSDTRNARSDAGSSSSAPFPPIGTAAKLLLAFLVGTPAFFILTEALELPPFIVILGLFGLLGCLVGSIVTWRSVKPRR